MSREPKTSPYGSWKSPITAELIVSSSVGLSQPVISGANLYWIEMRPTEGGRNVIVRRDASGLSTDVNPSAYNARTRAHEYGGGDYVVFEDRVYFSNFVDQRIYRLGADGPTPITPDGPMRFADGHIDASRRRLVCVREDHTESDVGAISTIVSLSLDENSDCGRVLVQGNDFYSSPRVSPDGSHLAWVSWNHPRMPWDESELWVAEITSDGVLANSRRLAGGHGESILQPEWSPGGVLYFVSDRRGWWNLHRITADYEIETVYETRAELGMPQWLFGMSSYAFASEDIIVCSHVAEGISTLGLLNTGTRKLQEVECAFTDIQYVRATKDKAVFRGGSPTSVVGIIEMDLATQRFEIVRSSNELFIENKYFSVPQPIEFKTEGGVTAHAFFYRPQNSDFRAPQSERPPLIVKSHGGPTAATTTALSLSVQYWTSRGFAVLDVNYGGSTGYGRQYRERLNGKWGIVDVDDCVNGARYLVNRGEVDAKRLIITGGSAGGYTTLCALTFRKQFQAGASHFGVSDLQALELDTHKFESRYSDGLVAPYPQRKDIYFERSPINFTERLSCPVIFFQGLKIKWCRRTRQKRWWRR
ncbi:MAG: prolyl oligopeptidase family serine peptidase [Pyrinomonadaceae bacterium]